MRNILTSALVGLSVLANLVVADYNRLDINKAAFLFVDHQTGLFGISNDINSDSFYNNVVALGETAKYFNASSIITSSREDGPNGPILPELKALLPNAPHIARPGQINAWDNEEFVKAVEATGKKQLIVSGIVTDVCVSFVALSARNAGYEVFVVTDASGTFNPITRDAAWARMQQSGVQLMNWFSVACELARDWRKDLEGLGGLFKKHIPNYSHIMDSYASAQAQAKNSTA